MNEVEMKIFSNRNKDSDPVLEFMGKDLTSYSNRDITHFILGTILGMNIEYRKGFHLFDNESFHDSWQSDHDFYETQIKPALLQVVENIRKYSEKLSYDDLTHNNNIELLLTITDMIVSKNREYNAWGIQYYTWNDMVLDLESVVNSQVNYYVGEF